MKATNDLKVKTSTGNEIQVSPYLWLLTLQRQQYGYFPGQRQPPHYKVLLGASSAIQSWKLPVFLNATNLIIVSDKAKIPL